MTSTNRPIEMTSRTTQLLIWLALMSSIHSSPILPFAPYAVVLSNSTDLKLSYDYVIVGGGTSGLVVANRLTEDPSSMCFYVSRSLRLMPNQPPRP
jgi:hypothetical protein